MNQSKLEKYLERIHYSGEVKNDKATLQQIHQLHPEYIPFENIDPYTGKVPSLNVDDVYQKLVLDSRGGYCYEQNLLLSEVLKLIGFKVELQLARVVWKREEDSIAAKSHMLLIVDLNGEKYVADCGFGTVTLTSPLLLNDKEPQQTPNGLFKVSNNNGTYVLWTWKEKWLPVYRFIMEHVEPIDLDISNWYLSTYPESNFKKNLVLSKVDKNARYTFTGETLNIRGVEGNKESIAIESNEQLYRMVKETFGLKENAVDLLKRKLEK